MSVGFCVVSLGVVSAYGVDGGIVVAHTDQAQGTAEETAVVSALRTGGADAFSSLTEPYRRELRAHCYRMVGNLEDAEDLVQETLLRAWRARAGFEGRSSLRAWLYRIATNVCLDAIKHTRRRVQVVDTPPGSKPAPSFDEVPWLQPFPDRLLEGEVPGGEEPEAAVVAKETIELAFLAAVQHLPPSQRAVLILRDVLGWSASETAEVLDGSVAAVNSALQRARTRLRELGQAGRLGWSPVVPPTRKERLVVQRYMEAHVRADAAAVIELLGDDVRFSMPPTQARFEGRPAVAAFFVDLFGVDNPGDWRLVPTRANGQPAVANYVRAWGEEEFQATTLDVLWIENGQLIEITTFDTRTFPAFGLPPTWSDSEPKQ
jgi:RNA polymerase sigma-70 factor (ECF subfamily)